MTKRLSFVLAALLLAVFAISAVGCAPSSDKESITVFNWGEYISDGSDDSLDVIKAFEEETGISVNYVTFASNEDMYASLSSGANNYDVIIPSDYMIARLAAEDKLLELDFNNIPNYANILDEYKNGQYYDPQAKFTVPYNVGLVGIIYNTTMVEGTPDSWNVMWDEKYTGSILQFNNSRDAFATAQFKLGLDVNSTDLSTWEAAYDELVKQNSIIKSKVMDEIFLIMEGENAALAAYYAGDFFKMYESQPNLAFTYPKEGTNIFIDCMCIPKGCKNKTAAEKFINYMCGEEAATANAEYICYASPNKLVTESEEYREIMEEIHPDAMDILYGVDSEYLAKCQYFHDLPDDVRNKMTTLWSNLNSESGSNTPLIIIGCAIFAAIIIAVVISVTRKKKRERIMNASEDD